MMETIERTGLFTTAANSFSLDEKVVVVTGATGVLGNAFVNGIAAAGAKVALIGRKEEVARERTLALQDEGIEAMYAVADVLHEASLQEAAQSILEKWGRIDGLVNGAGGNMPGAVIGPDQDIFSANQEAMRDVFDLNIFGTVSPTMTFGKIMAENGGGSIVNISSMAARQVITRVLGYSMAKAAVDNFTRWMSVEMGLRGHKGMRVNAIAPGFFVAEQNRSLLLNADGTPTARGESILRNTPFNRFGEPEELTGALVWLLSDASRFVTGEIIGVDGGFSVYSGV